MKGFYLAALLLVCGCAKAPEDRTWGVLVAGIPGQIATKEYLGNITFYVLKQTHEPILRKDDGHNYTSRILKNWSRDLESKKYILCPADGLRFSEKDELSLKDFGRHISAITAEFSSSATVKGTGECFLVEFDSPRRDYADFLTLYKNAPTRKESDKVELGLGPFQVKEISAGAIVLDRKKKVGNGYNQISIYEYAGPKDLRLQSREIKDFNLIPDFEVPQWVRENYVGFANVELRSMLLVINHRNPVVREQIYNCADVVSLRKAFVPGKSNFFDIKNVLPVGVPGAKAGLPQQVCRNIPGSKLPREPLVFANWRSGNSDEMGDFAKKFSERSGFRLKISDYAPAELVKLLNRKPHPYNLLVLLFDSVRPDPNAFFETFAGDGGLQDFYLDKIAQLYKDLERAADEEERGAISVRLAEEISRNHLAIPLYQGVRVVYYPGNISNVVVGRGFLEYPEVADFRW